MPYPRGGTVVSNVGIFKRPWGETKSPSALGETEFAKNPDSAEPVSREERLASTKDTSIDVTEKKSLDGWGIYFLVKERELRSGSGWPAGRRQ